jgi:hypothetical protein
VRPFRCARSGAPAAPVSASPARHPPATGGTVTAARRTPAAPGTMRGRAPRAVRRAGIARVDGPRQPRGEPVGGSGRRWARLGSGLARRRPSTRERPNPPDTAGAASRRR